MKWIAGILAAGLLAACGVGVDDPEGQAAAGVAQGQSALTFQNVAPTQGTAADGGSSTSPTGDNVKAPQDPIPAIPPSRPLPGTFNTTPSGGVPFFGGGPRTL